MKDSLRDAIAAGERDGRDVVRRGYDRIADDYLAARDRSGTSGDMQLLAEVLRRTPDGSQVLDLGCGAGEPVSAAIADAGHRLTGVDISAAQIERARALIPQATFIESDMTQVDFHPRSFDLIVAFFALFHVPRELHESLFRSLLNWLLPGGRLVATLGRNDDEVDVSPRWIGGEPMYWSHFDTDTSVAMLEQAGFVIEEVRWVPETLLDADFEHPFVVARRP